MERIEMSNVHKAHRRANFASVKWLTKSKFEEYIKSNRSIHPFTHQDSSGERFDPTKGFYIGKTLSSHIEEGVLNFYASFFDHRPKHLEIIGTVLKNSNNEWQLNVTYDCKVIEVKKNFLVLYIEDAQTYDWSETQEGQIPKYSLRCAIDQSQDGISYFYVGMNCLNGVEVDGEQYVENEQRLVQKVGSLFGKVNAYYKRLYLPFDGREVSFTKFYTLIMKPTPASLKSLCRTRIRDLLRNATNECIKSIIQSKEILHLPRSLIDFIKWPSYLSCGDCLFKGERIVSEDGKCELLLDYDGTLVCQQIVDNQQSKIIIQERKTIRKVITDFLVKALRLHKQMEATERRRIIAENCDTIRLDRFMILVEYSTNLIARFHNFNEAYDNYKLKIDENLKRLYYYVESKNTKTDELIRIPNRIHHFDIF